MCQTITYYFVYSAFYWIHAEVEVIKDYIYSYILFSIDELFYIFHCQIEQWK